MNAKHLALVRDLRLLGGTVCMDAAAALEVMERQILGLQSELAELAANIRRAQQEREWNERHTADPFEERI